MAAGTFVVPNPTKLNITNIASSTATNFRIALVGSGWTPAPATNEVWGDVSANEIANGGGYATGGGPLTGVTWTQTGGVAKLTSASFSWTITGSGIPAFRYLVVYFLGTVNGKINPLVAYALGDASNVDVPPTSVANSPLTFTPASTGIATLT